MRPPLALVSALLAPPAALACTLRGDALRWFALSVALSVGAFVVTSGLVPRIKVLTLRAGLGGKDLCKRGTAMEDKVVYVLRGGPWPRRADWAVRLHRRPEALGIVPGTVYVVALILCQVFHARTPDRVRARAPRGADSCLSSPATAR